jgi:hypothetical protein
MPVKKKKKKKKKTYTRKRKRRKSKKQLKEEREYPLLREYQKIQKQLIFWLRTLGPVDVEGRMYQYVDPKWQSLMNRYGYTQGLPQLEISNRRGKYIKCGIYLKDKLNKEDKRVQKLLLKQGYAIMIFTKKIPVSEMKQFILKNYLNLKIVKKRKRRKSVHNEGDSKKKKRKRRKITKTVIGYKEPNFSQEKVFHLKLVDFLRMRYKNVILDGKVEGNINKTLTKFSKRMGYINDVADISIKHPSNAGQYIQLDMELKIGSNVPRTTQKQMLRSLNRKYKHFPTYINTSSGAVNAFREIDDLMHEYCYGTDAKKLAKFHLENKKKKGRENFY